MKNQVIQVLDKEHGKKVIEYWKSKGVDTMGMCGSFTKEDSEHSCYYGVINDMFDCYAIKFVRKYNAEIIELPEEKTYPRVMMVSFDSENWHKRVVFMKKCGRYLAWDNAETVEEAENQVNSVVWRFAKDIEEPKEFTITLSDLNSKIEDIKKLFGIEDDDVIIKLD